MSRAFNRLASEDREGRNDRGGSEEEDPGARGRGILGALEVGGEVVDYEG